ncbi:MAG: UDP-3-O-(3-hydroxymyristoyl)glucosamine N-acyltransferase [Opitutales bacterium]
MEWSLPTSELRAILPHAQWEGVLPVKVTGVASLEGARRGDLSFLGNRKYARQVESTHAAVVLVPTAFAGQPADGQAFGRVDNPSLALAEVCRWIERQLTPRPAAGVHPSAVVDPTAEVDPSATIGPLCVVEAGARVGPRAVLHAQVFVGHEAQIGADSWLYAQVAVHRLCRVGERCMLHSGVVIGGDGFGFEPTPQGHAKVPQIGTVEIGDDVEIGANSTVDRGRFSPTRVGRGTKIDNLVQLAHNVEVGEDCFICSQVGISGSTKVGDYVVLGGQVGTVGHIHIGDRVQVGGQAGIAKNLAPGTFYTGTPAREFQLQRRIEAHAARLPEVFARLKAVEQAVAASAS